MMIKTKIYDTNIINIQDNIIQNAYNDICIIFKKISGVLSLLN